MTSDNRVVAPYLAAALVWGSSFLFMKVGLEGLSPAQVALSRLLLGALTLVVVMAVARRAWPRDRRTWGHLTVVGVLLCMVPYLLFAWAGQHLASGLSSIFNATTPLMTAAAVALLLPVERLTAIQRVGLAVGAVGVVVVVGPWAYAGDVATAAPLPAVLACLGATACYGLGTTYQRRFVVPLRLPPETVAAGQVSAGALLLTLASPLVATGPVHLTWPVVLSMLGLGALGTGLAYVWMARIIDAWGPQRASTVTYLTPLVGVLLGIVVLGEQLHWNEPVGGLLVVLGVVVAQRAGRRSAVPPKAALTTGTAADQRTDLDARRT
ncbi:DMT family transporter [Cellulomonas wangsupingiae]|uniref:DMT family transporter n=1 Tax=Cellulomonas wangsupingiae TaxID=2968085 RepID=A0ABY5K0P0_9CELL|nr:DMT family transporter [Cellulomonas wangsupingiae]MCC2335785.1 DMT family transporter [Cellulomonas wangsupingiae]UUI64017.1 DMT family transporter [Cellulomonas wangsupingiae]